MDSESGVLFAEPAKGLGHFYLGFIIVRGNGKGNYRIRYKHGGHSKVETGSDKGVAGSTVDPEKGPDISSRNGLDVFHLICMYANNPADLDFFPIADIDYGIAFGKGTLINPDVS